MNTTEVEKTATHENWVKIEGLYKAAYDAHSGTSFSPEKRAESAVAGHEEELNDDLKRIPEAEKQRYIDNYKKYLFAWMIAKSRCFSSMIAGPSNFPVHRMEKLNGYEHNRSVEFTEWRDKALKAIAKRIEDSKPGEQKANERWFAIKRNMERSIMKIVAIDNGESCYTRALFVNTITGPIKTFAKNGEVELVEKSLFLINYWNEISKKPIISAKNSIWSLADEAEKNREIEVDKSTCQSQGTEINGVEVIKNIAEDRIQLFFDGKPDPEMITALKHNAFKWSPSRGCWQRQLTTNAIYATNKILNSQLI